MGAVDGDGAFDLLFRDVAPRLRRLALVVTGDPEVAAELVQEAFAALHRQWDVVEDPERWLLTVTANRARSVLRRRRTARTYLPAVVARYAGRDQGPDSAERLAVRAALAGLTRDQRTVVFLRYYLDLPEADIADLLGCRPGTVKSRLHRGLSRLKEALDEQP